eukprot:6693766-Karenia_brevis.AAC.1
MARQRLRTMLAVCRFKRLKKAAVKTYIRVQGERVWSLLVLILEMLTAAAGNTSTHREAMRYLDWLRNILLRMQRCSITLPRLRCEVRALFKRARALQIRAKRPPFQARLQESEARELADQDCEACGSAEQISGGHTSLDFDEKSGPLATNQLEFSRAPTGAAEIGLTGAQRYCLGRCLGRGGFGTVHVATDVVTDATVAFKTVASADAHLERSGIELCRSLRHSNIAVVYDLFTDTTGFHVVMELCDWGDLWHVLYEDMPALGRLPAESEIRSVMHQLFSALSFMHDRDLVHRDVKPQNLALARSRALDDCC